MEELGNFPERVDVAPARLLREAEEHEEHDRGAGVDPAAHLDRDVRRKLRLPDGGREQLDEGEVEVRVRPGHPGRDVQPRGVDVDAERAERRNERHLDRAEEDQAQVAADSEGRVGGEDLVELHAVHVERAESERCNIYYISTIFES